MNPKTRLTMSGAYFFLLMFCHCLLWLAWNHGMAQSIPSGFTYQGIARDGKGQILQYDSLNLLIEIADPSGSMYKETHQVITNGFGLFTIIIGNGFSESGDLKSLDWSSGRVRIRTGIQQRGKPGGYAFGDWQPLMSVPYAMYAGHAKQAGDAASRALSDSVWLLTGNTGTSAIINYIGTNDAEDFVIKTNATERMRIKSNGEIGIGTINPSTSLEISGSFRAGDGSNYAQISPQGDLWFKGSGDYLVGPNRYAFRYQLNPNFGLYFNALNAQYEFHDASASPVFYTDAVTADTYIKGMAGIGTTSPQAKLDVKGDSRIGNSPVNYVEFSSSGDMYFHGNADFLVGGNRYAFRYSADEDAGLFFNQSLGRYEFRDLNANPIFWAQAGSKNAYVAGKLGIGVAPGQEVLTLSGALQIGNAAGNNAGTIRWTGSDFEGYNGLNWESLTRRDDADADPSNEIQELGKLGNLLFLTGGSNTVDLSGYLDNTDNQTLSLSGNMLSISGGNTVNLPVSMGPTGPTGPTGPVGSQGLPGPTGPTGPLVAGVAGQTLRHNGTGWEATSTIYNNGIFVGIGTTTPNSVMEVKGIGTTSATSPFRVTNGIGSPVLYASDNRRVGIGTTSPLERLHVVDDIIIGGGSAADGLSEFLRIDGKSQSWFIAAGNPASGADPYLSIGKGEQDSLLYIKSDGNIGVGTSVPVEKLTVKGAINLGSTADTTPGTIRWTGLDFEGYTASGWISLTAGAAGMDADWIIDGNDMYSGVGGFVGVLNNVPRFPLDVGGVVNAVDAYALDGDSVLRAPALENLVVGIEAGRFLGSSASFNTIVGNEAGFVANNVNNTYVGFQAGYASANGFNNAFFGYQAGKSNTNGNSNTFLGYKAGFNNTTANFNTFIGYMAGNYNLNKGYQTFTGYQAGYFNSTGEKNTFYGAQAGYNNNSGDYNTFAGFRAGYSNSSGTGNAYYGYQAGYQATSSGQNAFYGHEAGYNNRTGGQNTFIGYNAGRQVLDGDKNTFTGAESGYNTVSGMRNVFAGYRSGYNNINGNYNTFLGFEADVADTGVHGSIAIGYRAKATASAMLVIGSQDPDGVITDAFLGSGVTAFSPADITLHATGGAGMNIAGADFIIAGGTSTGNAPGGSIRFQTSPAGPGGNNPNSLTERMIITETGNVGIGTSTPGYLFVVNGDAAKPGGGMWTVISDERLKEGIKPFSDGIDVIQRINPVRYHYNSSSGVDTDREYVGITAQQLLDVAPYMVNRFTRDTIAYYGVDPSAFTYILINAVKQQQEMIDRLNARITELEKMHGR